MLCDDSHGHDDRAVGDVPTEQLLDVQTGPTALTSVAYLNGLVAQITAVADYVGTDTGSINLGTWSGSTLYEP